MKRAVALAAAAAAAVLISACGQAEANQYNVGNNLPNIKTVHWVRIWSPHEYTTFIRGCLSGDGIYVANSGSGADVVTVVPHDPACA